MPSGRSLFIILGIVVVTFAITVIAYPRLPSRVASHWNAAGRADGWMPKGFGVFLLPIVMTALAALFMVIPAIDPLKRNFASFRAYYDTFIILFLLFFLVIQLHILLWNLGRQVSPNRLLPIPFGALLYYTGILVEHARRNWFVGIRTPWTLSSDHVWDQTHRVTGRLLRICGALCVIGFAFGDRWLWFLMGPLVLVCLFSVAYSYYLYRRAQPPI